MPGKYGQLLPERLQISQHSLGPTPPSRFTLSIGLVQNTGLVTGELIGIDVKVLQV